MKPGKVNDELKEFKFKLPYEISKDDIVFHAKLRGNESVYDVTWLSIVDNERKYVSYSIEGVKYALSIGLWIKVKY